MSDSNDFADSEFKVDATGRTIFFPWGFVGPGYVLLDPKQQKVLRNYNENLAWRLMPMGIASSAVIGLPLTLAGMAAYGAWEFIRIRRITRNLEKSKEQLSFREDVHKLARRRSWATLVTMLVILLGFIGYIFSLPESDYPGRTTDFIGIYGIFGSISIWIVYVMAIKVRLARRALSSREESK